MAVVEARPCLGWQDLVWHMLWRKGDSGSWKLEVGRMKEGKEVLISY